MVNSPFGIPANEKCPCNGGTQYLFSFDNGFGASVVRHAFSYGGMVGRWEIAVLQEGHICYDTDITDDVIGYLSADDVSVILEQIKNLTKEGKEQ